MKDGDTIKIKCPECGAVLTAIYNSKVKTVKCPVCKQVNMFAAYKAWTPEEDYETDIKEDTKKEGPGKLVDLRTGKEYQLLEGTNTIGRKPKHSSPKASVPIETDDMYMSRLQAEIKYDNGIHYFKILFDKNESLINGQPLTVTDIIILQGGETIKFANTELHFKLPKDDDDTQI